MAETERPRVFVLVGLLAAIGGLLAMGIVSPPSLSVVVVGGVLLVLAGLGLNAELA